MCMCFKCIDQEYKKNLFKPDLIAQILREALESQHCRCSVCNYPATRQVINTDFLFCDDHGLYANSKYEDLRGAKWIRQATMLLWKCNEYHT